MAIPATFFSRADAIAVVFSLTQEYTFEKVEKWIENIFNYKSSDNVTVAVLGNKKDLVDEITVTDDQIRKLCSDKDIKYFACSAKTGEGVNEVFDYFTEKVSERKNIVGSSPENIRHFIELRGIGIVDVKTLFGVSSVKDTQSIDLVIRLEDWNKDKEYDRLGLEEEYTEYH